MKILLRNLARSLLMIFLGTSINGCADNTLTWKEEVKLLDGRVIIVEQKRRYDRGYTGQEVANIPREAWVTFKLPEFSNQDIVWHESLEIRVLNVFEGKLYIVGFPFTYREFQNYGKPAPPHIGYRYENKQWTRLQFNQIPAAIYDTNMWLGTSPDEGATFISLSDKAKLMKSNRYDKDLKRIDPNHKSNFE